MRIKIPTSLSDIRLEQFVLFNKVFKESQEESFVKLALVTIFCDLSVEDAKNIVAKDFDEIALNMSSVLAQQPRFIQRFIHNGKEYGFIPNLDEITAGEYIDLELFLSSDESYNKAMSVLYRPILNKRKDLYNIEEYKGSHTEFNTLNLEIVLGSMLFFWNLSNELLIAMKGYLAQPKNRTLLEAALAQNGVGINQFLQSLEDVSLILKEQLNSRYTNF
ncbi:hypothetical protein UFOVP516_23 [uncultured Caudovirales phage]|uniref:Uncharacterized protein n=1 Tax=uncultured Caudovirales phage TaxID=2100421 RepID=A0A6J5MPJ1_9CAUD|nr:hypothetical protein UFOVP516_23 [uncultured Caudovirales phage]